MADDKKNAQKAEKHESPQNKKPKNFTYRYGKNNTNLIVGAVIVLIVIAAAGFMAFSAPRLLPVNTTTNNSPSAPAPAAPAPPSDGLSGTTLPPPPPVETQTPPMPPVQNQTPPEPAPAPEPEPAPAPVFGLKAEYYDSTTLSGDVAASNIVSPINIVWSDDNPAPGVNWKRFSARFSGKVVIDAEGDYVFILTGDDGARFWIDGTRRGQDIWDNSGVSSTSATIHLKPGEYDLKIEYRNIGGNAKLKLEYWASGIGIARQVIPADKLKVA